MKIDVTDLRNGGVILEPVTEEHRPDLLRAASDETLWAHMPLSAIGDRFDPWFNWVLKQQAAGSAVFFSVRRIRTGEICGTTSYLNIAPEHKRLEIGFTWYTQDAQGTEVNPSAKLLLLSHAFDCGANRVELKCDAKNSRSRAAIRKLGAAEEGTLRQHMIVQGGILRDTTYFSILAEEWPAVREDLENRVARCLETN